MPHTSGISGRSLVPDFSQGFEALSRGISIGLARREKEQEEEKQGLERQQKGELAKQVLADDGGAEEALSQIFLIDPVFGKNIQGLADRRNDQEIKNTQRIVETGAKAAVFISGIEDNQQSIKAIGDHIKNIQRENVSDQEKSARIKKWVDIANETPLQRGLSLQKMQILGTATDVVLRNATTLQQTEQQQIQQGTRNLLEGIRNDVPAIQNEKLNRIRQNLLGRGKDTRVVDAILQAPTDPELVGNRNDLIDQFLTRTRAPEEARTVRTEERAAARKAPVPFTTIGKARADLKAGNITQEDFNSLQKAPQEFKSSVGKLIGDRQIAIEEFGADSEQVQAITAAIESDSKGEGPKLSDVGGVRKEFTKLSGDFIKIRDAFKKVQRSGADPTAAGDLALIFNFMKILDPGSVVRESEFATAQNSGSVPSRIRAQYNKILRGERLDDIQRKDFVDRSKQLFEGQRTSQIALEKSFNTLATSQGMKPEDVVIDFVGEFRPTGTGEKTLNLSGMTDKQLIEGF